MRVLVIGLTRELPLSPTDAMDIADVLVARAASAHTEGRNPINACACTCMACLNLRLKNMVHNVLCLSLSPPLYLSFPLSLHLDIARLPSIERKELFNAIFDITTYRPPANIQLPEGYQPPTLTISKLYWKGWILLLVHTCTCTCNFRSPMPLARIMKSY